MGLAFWHDASAMLLERHATKVEASSPYTVGQLLVLRDGGINMLPRQC